MQDTTDRSAEQVNGQAAADKLLRRLVPTKPNPTKWKRFRATGAYTMAWRHPAKRGTDLLAVHHWESVLAPAMVGAGMTQPAAYVRAAPVARPPLAGRRGAEAMRFSRNPDTDPMT